LDDGLAFQGRLLFGDKDTKQATSPVKGLSRQSLDLPSAEENKTTAADRYITNFGVKHE
jgi:hypothetical protein